MNALVKVLFIGGTGNISSACSRLAIERGMDLFLLQRGQRSGAVPGAHLLYCDVQDPKALAAALDGHSWDAVVNWIAFTPEDIERDLTLFRGRTKQYVFISSASVYQKPPSHPVISESTPLKNPFWQYSRNKIASEERLNRAYREEDFPGVIVRPSLTYDTVIPLAIGSWGDYTMIERMRQGRPVVVHGDGTSLWTVTHAEDFAVGLVGLLGHPAAEGHAFHITSDEVLTWNQIWQQCARAAGCEANLIHVPSDFIVQVEPSLRGSLLGDKAASVIFDNSKIKAFVPEFAARIPWRVGIRRTLDWFEAEPSRMRIIPEHHAIHDRILAAWKAVFMS